jgi:hypothetical protein
MFVRAPRVENVQANLQVTPHSDTHCTYRGLGEFLGGSEARCRFQTVVKTPDEKLHEYIHMLKPNLEEGFM